jgi:hypothetical protein
MFWKRSSAQITRQWRSEIEAKVEAGRTPRFEIGLNDAPAEGSLVLAALHRLAHRRADITSPLILTGGRGPLWLAALCSPLPARKAPGPREPRVVFAGISPADYLAVSAIAAPETAWPRRFDATTAIEPRSQFAPRAASGFLPAWDTLPFLDTAAPLEPLTDQDDPSAQWIVRAVYVLAFGLFLLALLP